VIGAGFALFIYGWLIGLIAFGSLRSWLVVRDKWKSRRSQVGGDSWTALTPMERGNFFLIPLCIFSGAAIIVATLAVESMH
jgi:hypothetical protein